MKIENQNSSNETSSSSSDVSNSSSPIFSDVLGKMGPIESEAENSIENPEVTYEEEKIGSGEQKEEFPVDKKYTGKKMEDVIKMHQEAEKMMHEKAQELSEYKKTMDSILKTLQDQQQLVVKNQEREVPQQSPKYFHEYSPDVQHKAAQQFQESFENNPVETMFGIVSNLPYYMDKAISDFIEGKDFVNKMVGLIGGYQQHYNKTNVWAENQKKSYFEQNKEAQTYRDGIDKIIGEWNDNGVSFSLLEKGYKIPQIIDMAYKQALADNLPKERENLEKVIREKIENEIRQGKKGFQITQSSEQKIQEEDEVDKLFGLSKKRNLFGF